MPNAISKGVLLVCNVLRLEDIYGYWQGDIVKKKWLKLLLSTIRPLFTDKF